MLVASPFEAKLCPDLTSCHLLRTLISRSSQRLASSLWEEKWFPSLSGRSIQKYVAIFTHSQWLQGHELIPLACHPGCCTSAFVTQAAQPRRMETRRPTSGTLPRADFLGDELAGLCREALGPGDSLEAGGKDHSHRCRQRGCSRVRTFTPG